MSFAKRSNTERRGALTRAILLSVQTPDDDEASAARSLAELEQLLLGLGVSVTETIVQRRPNRASVTYVGEGKLRELAAITGGSGEITRGPEAARRAGPHQPASEVLVVVDDELSPGQQRNLELALDAEVIDRTAVILRVFESRAHTREARLQVELARLEYELPRVRDDHSLGDREGGGGRASRGHSNVELAKQRARERSAAIRRELEQLSANADQRRQGRHDTFRVALVGYTNAGKSSLMRRLTGSEVYIEDKLFATLGTTVRPLAPPIAPPVLVADTVGFLHRLPHALIASFRSTLAEAHEAWLLLNVADASDPEFRAQIAVTEQVLREIDAAPVPTLLLLNKADRLTPEQREALVQEFPEALVVSALDPHDCARLRSAIVAFFARHLSERTFRIPYARQGILAELRDRLQVVREDYGEELSVTVRATPDVLGRLAARLSP